MTLQEVGDALIEAVQRHASLQKSACSSGPINLEIKPYPDLGMDSMHDVNIACEVEATLGIQLPPKQTVLYEGHRPLSILESAERILSFLAKSTNSIP